MDLNWEAIGAVGEIVGAAAVFISLTYLALQLKAANTLSRAESREKANELFDRWRSKLVLNEELSDIWERGVVDPESLSESESHRFRWLMLELIHNLRVQYLRASDLNQSEEMVRVKNILSIWIQSPGFDVHWPSMKVAMEPEFGELIDNLRVEKRG